jgi:hypothetical protein
MLDWLISTPWPILFLAFLWTIPCECLCKDCVICSDDFDRADSDDISTGSDCGWTEAEGAAEIKDLQLRFTTADSRIMSNTANAGNQYIDLGGRVAFGAVGDQFKVYFDFSNATNNHYVLFEQTDANTVSASLFRAGVQQGDTVNFGANLGALEPWHVCVFEGTLRVTAAYGFVTQTGAFFDTSSFFGASAWGLGTGTLGNDLFIDDLVANRSDLDGCRCRHPCSPDCAAEQRIDIVAGAVPAGCSGNCQNNAGIVNGASFYLISGGALWTGAAGQCALIPNSSECGWFWNVDEWCSALQVTSINWNMVIERGDELFEIPDRIRITYVEQWMPDGINFTQRWVVFEDTTTFNFSSECAGMVSRNVPQTCFEDSDDALQCVGEDLEIQVTSIV